ncbi:helix-turn-helix transcriptional regulator [Microvirga arabica]|uniref:Helix-turn-helix transcriptional regulator n=1 Tax=Microvirga arabica TaxID=1128671 RepID=A0ABV6YER1_9HYPH
MSEPLASQKILDPITAALSQPFDGLGNLPLEVARHRVLDVKQTAALLSLSVPSVRRLHRQKQIPEALRISSRRIGWRLGDLVDWLAARSAA